VSSKSIKEQKIGEAGEEAAVKARVIAPERGMRINREDGGEELGD